MIVEPDLNQERVGTGTALALQVKTALSPTFTIVCTGGSVNPAGQLKLICNLEKLINFRQVSLFVVIIMSKFFDIDRF